VASVLVALSPESSTGPSARHSAAVAFGVVATGLWPCLAADYG
jgi:nitrate reductase NapE component